MRRLRPIGKIRALLGVPHEYLAHVWSWYRRWHEHPQRSHHHRLILHFVGWTTLAVSIAKTVTTILLIHSFTQGTPALAASQTWTSQADWQTFTHTNTQATVDGKVELNTTGAASWANVSGVPYTAGSYKDVSSTSSSNVWIARGTDDPIVYNGTSWAAVSNSGLDTTAVFTRSASNVYFGSSLGGISQYNGSTTSVVHTLDPLGSNVYDIDGSADDNIWAVGSDGAVAYYNGSTWSDAYSQPGGVTETFLDVLVISSSNVWWTGQNAHIYHYNGSTVEQLDIATGLTPAAPLNPTAISGADGDIWVAYYESFLESGDVRHTNGVTFDTPLAVSCSTIDGLLYLGASDIWAISQDCVGDNFYHYNGTAWSSAGVSGAVLSIDGDATEMWAVGPTNVVLKSTVSTYEASGTALVVNTPDWQSSTFSFLVGHSSDTRLHKYSSVFAPLRGAALNDLLYINVDGVTYTYQVDGREIASPTDQKYWEALTNPPASDLRRLALVTCWPILTTRDRLVVTAHELK